MRGNNLTGSNMMKSKNKREKIKIGVTKVLSSLRRKRGGEKLSSDEKLIFSLQEASRHLASETDVAGILSKMAETIGKALGAKWVNFWDFTADKQHIYIIAAYKMQKQYIEHVKDRPIKLGEAWIGRAMKTGKVWCTTDMLTDPFLPSDFKETIKKQGNRGMLCAPLLVKDEVIGGVCIYFGKPHHFSDFELRLVDVVANQAATALENTKIFRSLFAEKKKTEVIVMSLHDGLIVYDLDGKIVVFNRRAEELLWVRKAEVINKLPSSLDVKENKLFENIKEISLLYLVDFEIRELKINNPERRNLQITLLPLRDENDQKTGSMIVLHDVTLQKESEELKNQFVSIASHQLRTPLSAFKWALNMILKEELGPVSERQREIIKNCYTKNENLIDFISDLLDVSRIEEERFGYSFISVDAEKFIVMVKQVIQDLSNQITISHFRFSFKQPEKISGMLKVDQEKIKMAIQNILTNAVKYTKPGGSITVSVDIGESSVILNVSDTGIGIPEDQKKYIFTKFFRARNAILMQVEGSGFGLWIANEIIKKHKGRIFFETKENIGSSFSIQLPLEKI